MFLHSYLSFGQWYQPLSTWYPCPSGSSTCEENTWRSALRLRRLHRRWSKRIIGSSKTRNWDKQTFQDDFPFPHVGYVIVPRRVSILKKVSNVQHISLFQQHRELPFFGDSRSQRRTVLNWHPLIWRHSIEATPSKLWTKHWLEMFTFEMWKKSAGVDRPQRCQNILEQQERDLYCVFESFW